MSTFDRRGCSITGATPVALEEFERSLAAFQSWRVGADIPLQMALDEAPDFVMAHVLQAYLALCSRDPQRVRSASAAFARAARLPANAREQAHLEAINAVLSDDYEGAKARLGGLLRSAPRDVLALQVVHAFDYVTGDIVWMRDHVAGVLSAWSSNVPGYHTVLAMHAFALEECGDYERAERFAHDALALNPADARAHHVMAHVFEMTGRAREGARWMNDHIDKWHVGTVVATHCWWHVALFHLAEGQIERALKLYDQRVRASRSSEMADLIDASALLWRIELQSHDNGKRWNELASAWAPHIDDGFCSFSDLHAMLAFVGARNWDRAQQLELALGKRHSLPTRHGATTRLLGLPACQALMAYGRGDYPLAITLLASLPAIAHRLGGSHAQRDVLNLTLQHAVERIRRPARQFHMPAMRSQFA